MHQPCCSVSWLKGFYTEIYCEITDFVLYLTNQETRKAKPDQSVLIGLLYFYIIKLARYINLVKRYFLYFWM